MALNVKNRTLCSGDHRDTIAESTWIPWTRSTSIRRSMRIRTARPRLERRLPGLRQ